jgi:hypothetical protein
MSSIGKPEIAVQTTPSNCSLLRPRYEGQRQHVSMSTKPRRGQMTWPASTARTRSFRGRRVDVARLDRMSRTSGSDPGRAARHAPGPEVTIPPRLPARSGGRALKTSKDVPGGTGAGVADERRYER